MADMRVVDVAQPVVVVGDSHVHAAEGMQIVTRHVLRAVQASGRPVSAIQQRAIGAHVRALTRIRPLVVVFCQGPGVGTLLLAALYRALGQCRVVMVAPRPDLERCPDIVLRVGRPDLVLTPRGSDRAERMCVRNGWPWKPVAFGVDTSQFFPVDEARQATLRAQLGLPNDKPILLHVGHLRPNRGLLDLLSIAQAGSATIVVIASPALPPTAEIDAALRSAGIVVVTGYQPSIAAYYQAADLFLFPTPPETNGPGGAIDLPLSVLEAAACGVPVLARDFGGLRAYFANRQGITFAVNAQAFQQAALEYVNSPRAVRRQWTTGARTGDGIHAAIEPWSKFEGAILAALESGSG